MADFTQSAWSNKIMRAPLDERRELIRQLNAGKHRVTDDAGQALDLSPPPATCTTAPRVELTRDQFGRIKRVTPVEPDQAKVEPRGEIDMDRFRGQMRLAESFKGEDKQKAIKAIYLEHLGIEI